MHAIGSPRACRSAARRRSAAAADDAFGQTKYSPDAAARWAAELARLLEALDDRHWLISGYVRIAGPSV